MSQCRGFVVGEAAERLGIIGEPPGDVALLEQALARGDRDADAERIQEAVRRLRAKVGGE